MSKTLTTDKAIKAMMEGKKLRGFDSIDYCCYDTSYANPFRYIGENGYNNRMQTVWETNHNNW